MCFNKRRTVLALTRIFRRCSWRAIFRMARRDHFRSRMGSPPVSWRSRWAMALITAGFFFLLLCAHPRLGARVAVAPPLPATPAGHGPPGARPIPETLRSSGRRRSLLCGPPTLHRDAAAAHPANCKTERSPLSVPATAWPPPPVPQSPGLLAELPAASVVPVSALPQERSRRTHLLPRVGPPDGADKAGARSV